MDMFNRIVATTLWILLFIAVTVVAVIPLGSLAWMDGQIGALTTTLSEWRQSAPTNFVVGQAAAVVVTLLLFGTLIGMEILRGRRRGVRVRTSGGGAVELDTASIGRRISWQVDQVAEVVSVVPSVKSRGSAVDIRLEVETAPDIDVPMKTDEVVNVTRELIEQEMGLKLGKLDVHMRYAPYDPDWT